MAAFDPNNPQAFQQLVASWGGDTGKARAYGEQYGYSSNQLANFYNQGNPNSTLTGREAAGLLGVSPENSWQSLNKGYQTQDPKTGQFRIDPSSPENITGWTPTYHSKPISQLGDQGFYDAVQWAAQNKGREGLTELLKEYMQVYGYSPDDIARAYNQGSNWSSNVSPADVSAWLGGATGSGTPPPRNIGMTLYGDDITDKFSGSYSGLDEDARRELVSFLMPRLFASLENYRKDIDDSTRGASELYSATAKNAIKRDLQKVLNQLASRNVMNSSTGSDAISKAMAGIADSAGERAYQSGMSAAAMKTQEPSLLLNALNLGQSSRSSNPLEPYKLMSDIFADMMR